MKLSKDEEYDSYEEYSNEIDNSPTKEDDRGGSKNSNKYNGIMGSSYDAPTTANNSTAIMYKEQPTLSKQGQSKPVQQHPSIPSANSKASSMIDKFRSVKTLAKDTPIVNNQHQSQSEFRLPAVGTTSSVKNSIAHGGNSKESNGIERQSLPELKKPVIPPLSENNSIFTRNPQQNISKSHQQLPLTSLKQQEATYIHQIDVQPEESTIQKENQLPPPTQQQPSSAANRFNKFRVHKPTMIAPAISQSQPRQSVSKIVKGDSSMHVHSQPGSTSVVGVPQDNPQSFVERMQNKRLHVKQLSSQALSRRSEEEELQQSEGEEEEEEEEEEDPEVVAQREEEERLNQEEAELLEEKAQLEEQMRLLNIQITDVIQEQTGTQDYFGVVADKNKLPNIKNSEESARMQKQFLYQQKKAQMKPQLGIQRMGSVRKDIKSKVATNMEANQDPQVLQKQVDLLLARLENYKGEYEKLKLRIDSDGDTFTLENSLRKIDIDIKEQQKFNAQLNRSNLTLIKHSNQLFGVKQYRPTLDDESQIDATIKQKKTEMNRLHFQFDRTQEMIEQLHETVKREREQLKNTEEKMEELNMEYEMYDPHMNLAYRDNGSASSLDRPKPFDHDTPIHTSGIPRPDKLCTQIDKLRSNLMRFVHVKDVTIRSQQIELSSLHHQHAQVHHQITGGRLKKKELDITTKEQQVFIERCSLWLQGKLVITQGIEEANSIYTSQYTEMEDSKAEKHLILSAPSLMQKINKSRYENKTRESSDKQQLIERKGSIGAKKDQLKEEMETLIRQLSPIDTMEDEPHILNNIQSPNFNNEKNKKKILLQDDDGAIIIKSTEETENNQLPKIESSASIRASKVKDQGKSPIPSNKPPRNIASSSASQIVKGRGAKK